MEEAEEKAILEELMLMAVEEKIMKQLVRHYPQPITTPIEDIIADAGVEF
jgi:hypothetical protein